MDTSYRAYIGGLSGVQKLDVVGGVCEILLLRSAGPRHLSHTSCLLCLQTVPTSQRLEEALENLHGAVLWRPARSAPGGCLVRALDLAMCSGFHALSRRASRGEFEPPTEHLAYLLLLFLKLSYLLHNSC